MRAAAVALSALALAGGYGPPERAGTIVAAALPEVSGLTAASVVPGGWWVLNDSGSTPELHLISSSGRLLASVSVRGATNVDWEDLASRGRDLYIADIGDNDRVRDDLAVYRVREPGRDAGSVAAQRLSFRYPDGRHNAEALFVDPASGRIYVVTKSEPTGADPSRVYRFPLPLGPGRRVTLERVGGAFAREVALLPLVTGAALSSDGRRLVVRTYWQAFEWHRRAGSSFESVFASVPQPVKLPVERQGESIAFARDGRSLATTSEQLPAPLWRLPAR